jgi:hypothetical protein
MSRYDRQTFDPGLPLFSRKTFVANGRTLAPGTPFNWKRMAVDLRKVSTLFASGYLMHAPEDEAAEAPAIEREIQDEDTPDAALDAGVEEEPQTATEPQADDVDADSVDDIDDIAALQDLARGSGRKKITKNARTKLIGRGEAW